MKSVLKSVLFLACLWILLLLLNSLGFCVDKMKFTTSKSVVPIDSLVSGVTSFNELTSEMLYEYIKIYPKSVTTYNGDFFSFEERYYAVIEYFYPPNTIKKDNNTFSKQVVGVSYWQSYGACGKPTYGLKEDIYKGSRTDLKFNPYKNQKGE